MGKGSKKSVAAKNRRKAKKNEKRLKKEMEKEQIKQKEMQVKQSEIEENEEYVYTGEVRSINEIVEEMKAINQKRNQFVERIQCDVQNPIDRKMEQILERQRAEEADRKRDMAYKKVVEKILNGEEER